ncbi:hypothetical protein HMI01_11880 [Halolactibacillus miurensis]|uniref:Uncharacterized protein n=1 Tax=Halolactibacillus miurensis TaxID=306541 RepID=A0ABQ0VUN2_9BACI|nr:hypothetical protein HMI01_11880 [Halolactibacillus miurensis]
MGAFSIALLNLKTMHSGMSLSALREKVPVLSFATSIKTAMILSERLVKPVNRKRGQIDVCFTRD